MRKSRFSDQQKRIAMLLLEKPQSADELNKQLKSSLNSVSEDLKVMLKLELISRLSGFPTRYELKESIAVEVRKRKEIAEKDAFLLRLKVIIEVQAIEESLLVKELDEIIEKLNKEDVFTIYDVSKAEIVLSEDSEFFSSFLDVNLSVKDFHSLMRLMFLYGPSSVEVLKPEKWNIHAETLQEGLMLIADMVQMYSDYIGKKMNREELLTFNTQLFSKQNK